MNLQTGFRNRIKQKTKQIQGNKKNLAVFCHPQYLDIKVIACFKNYNMVVVFQFIIISDFRSISLGDKIT